MKKLTGIYIILALLPLVYVLSIIPCNVLKHYTTIYR